MLPRAGALVAQVLAARDRTLWVLAAVPVLLFLLFLLFLARSPPVQPRVGALPLGTAPLWGLAALLFFPFPLARVLGCRLVACLATRVLFSLAWAPGRSLA